MYALIVHDFDMTYLIHVTVPDHLSVIMLHVYIDAVLVSCYNSCSDLLLLAHVYFVTLPDTCYPVCSDILCMFCIAYILLLQTYAHLHVHLYHVTTIMFMSITSPLDNISYYIGIVLY